MTLLHRASPSGSTLGTSRRFLLIILASDKFAGPLLARHKQEGLYPIAPRQEEKEDRMSAWKRGVKRGKNPACGALDIGSTFEPSLLSIPPLLLPNHAGCQRQHPSTEPVLWDTLPD